ncbi:MAG: 6-phosphogluconolactonase [Trueperaceae bacterium]|nr:6-phosphogluconolactonase [Trueperaceae bacterium]
MTRPVLHVVDDVADIWVPRFVAACHHAVAERGRFVVALAGGGTPLEGYRRLRERRDLPWERVWLTWGDERDVPRTHADRNERAAREALLDHVPLAPGHVLAWPYGPDPDASAEAHARTLHELFGDPLDLDLALLGLGADAHTASLFPGTGAAAASGTTTVVRPDPHGPARLSLTGSALSRAREAWVLVVGADKRQALARTLAAFPAATDAEAAAPDADAVDALPLTAVRPREALLVFADPAAAGRAATEAS